MAKKFDKNTVLEAIKGTGGIITTIAKRLGVEWHTAQRYISKWELTRNAYNAEKEFVLDMCENQLIGKIKAGNLDAIKFYLKTKGKVRNYHEHDIIDVNSGTTIKIDFNED